VPGNLKAENYVDEIDRSRRLRIPYLSDSPIAWAAVSGRLT